MQLPVFIPNIKQKSTKDYILRLLTFSKSMTNQQIFNALKKEYAVSITYQSVRQALMELTDAKVLDKNQRKYSISIKWISSTQEYINLLKERYVDKKDIKIVDKKTKEITLNSLCDLGHFLMYSFHEHFFDMNRENDLYMVLRHLYFPFFHKKKRDLIRNFLEKNDLKVFVAKRNAINILLKFFYKKYGSVKLGAKFDYFFDIIIQGDCLAKIYMTDELKQRLDRLYSTKNLLNFNAIDEFADVTYAYYPIKIIITRDKQMAEEIKNQLNKV